MSFICSISFKFIRHVARPCSFCSVDVAASHHNTCGFLVVETSENECQDGTLSAWAWEKCQFVRDSIAADFVFFSYFGYGFDSILSNWIFLFCSVLVTICLCVSVALCGLRSCRISPPRFLAECRKRRVNQGSFVLLCFALFAFCIVFCLCILLYCFVCQYQSSNWLWSPPPKWPRLCRLRC